jgi:hypothetical protein
MALVTFGGPFSQGAVAVFAKLMCHPMIIKAGLDAFEGRILDAVAEDALILLETLQVL